VQVLKLYDRQRRPPNWTDIVKPGQFVAFAKDLDSGVPCDDEGRRLATESDATCVVFDSLDDARRFAEERTAHHASLRFDIFDAEGRANPPLLTVVSPHRAHTLDNTPHALRRRSRIAAGLFIASIPLFAFQYWGDTEGVFVLPMIIGINLIVAAGRLVLMNLGIREAERRRQERVADALRGAK
jgi:hypothetical protein